ncbi:Dynamin- GTPase protein [Gurleya vavrai]
MTTENLIQDKLHNIQDILQEINHDILLPQIVVIGSQSSGKSSVLEKILMLDILPKGTNIVTRCPIKIHTRKCSEEKEYFVMNKTTFHNLESVKTELENEMKRVCGEGFNISEEEITIFLYLKNTIEITLVDLPGLTKIPIKNQPTNVEKQILDLTMKYITNKNSIILPIIPANADISTSEALKICKKVDPLGTRTLGIITKIDLMDMETDCLEILLNKCFPLLMGYIGTVNRGQGDLNNKTNILQILQKEKKFFKSHKKYEKLFPNLGTEYLNEKLKEYFFKFVKKELPELKNKIQQKVLEIKRKIDNIKHHNLTKDEVVLHFCKIIKCIVKQKNTYNEFFLYNSKTDLMVEFKEFFNFKNEKYVFNIKIIEEIKNKNTVFWSENLFNKIIYERYNILTILVIEKYYLCFEILKKHIFQIEASLIELNFDFLKEKLCEIMFEKLQICINEIKNYSKIQTSYINTNYPDFRKTEILKNVILKHQKKFDKEKSDFTPLFGFFSQKNQISIDKKFDDHNFDIDLLYEMTDSYFNCMRNNFIDYSIKLIYFQLFYFLKSELNEKYLNDVNFNFSFDEINKSAEDLKNQLLNEKFNFEKAAKILHEF